MNRGSPGVFNCWLLLILLPVLATACGDLQPADEFVYLTESKWLEAQGEPKDVVADAVEAADTADTMTNDVLGPDTADTMASDVSALDAADTLSGDASAMDTADTLSSDVVGADALNEVDAGLDGAQSDTTTPACLPASQTADCDDGAGCTDDLCKGGACVHPFNTAPCDDADACTHKDACDGGKCVGIGIDVTATCGDGNICTLDTCEPKDKCKHVPLNIGCEDGSACTLGDSCSSSQCVAGEAADCGDGELCTDDSCDAAKGCQHTANTAPCDDGDSCTAGDGCADGTCQAGANCCTCAANADCASKDGDLCAAKLFCDKSKSCTVCAVDLSTAVTCDAKLAGPCQTVACDPKDGACKVGPGNEGGDCDDADACTAKEACKAGTCVGLAIDVTATCGDGNACTIDTCESKEKCQHAPLTGPCEDASACTVGDNCKDSQCVPGEAPNCDDGEPCTDDSCDPTKGCQHVANAIQCDDGDVCTAEDACKAGKCTGTAKACPSTTWPCHEASCDAKSGQCAIVLTVDGAGCGAGKGKCAAGACIWAENGHKWGLVPGGKFQMGCNKALDPYCANKPDESPQHLVTITASFWLSVFETTTAEYAACVSEKKCTAPNMANAMCGGGGNKDNNWSLAGPKQDRAQHPVNCVKTSQAKEYCAWAGGFLPSEAQWELAARGRCDENGGLSGCETSMRTYPWGEAWPVCGAHYVKKSCGASVVTWPVGVYTSKGYGPYGHGELAGNVGEIVSDTYTTSFYAQSKAAGTPNPMNTKISVDRAVRGGNRRASEREWVNDVSETTEIGFRCARAFP